MIIAEIWVDDVILPLLGFVTFPILQYLLLKAAAKQKGKPEVWYFRRFDCFRLVIRNETKKRILTDIKVKSRIRKVHREVSWLTTTWEERVLDEHEELFTFPKNDHVMICFRIEGPVHSTGKFIRTDKFGAPLESIPICEFDYLLCDYLATIKNPFNLDVKLAKRIKLKKERMNRMLEEIRESSEAEQELNLEEIADVG